MIVRAGEGHEIHHEGGGPGRLYQDLGTLRGPNRVIEPMIATFTEPVGVFPLYQHPGVEFLHVLEGSLDYGYGGNAYRLDAGDTMQIHGEVAHGPVELIELPVRFMSIKVYPAQRAANRGGRMTPWACWISLATEGRRHGPAGSRWRPRDDAMGLLILAGYAGQGDPSRSIVLWVLLVAALGLTYWECRERGYRLKVLL